MKKHTTIYRRMIVSFIYLLLTAVEDLSSLKLIQLKVPPHTETGQSVVLECLYELDGDELYSVKWYKDTDEFYRYVPKDTPPAQIFKLPGVTVNQYNSTNNSVRLENVELDSSGKYRCEVSAEAPSFTTVEFTKEMTVYDVPDDGPQISGGRTKYNLGDTVHVNCTAIRSKPAAELEWHVNGDKATPDILHKYPIIVDHEGLETSILGLEFEVEQRHFSNGDLKLQCTASISYIYQNVSTHVVMGEHVRASLLESKAGTITVASHNAGKNLMPTSCSTWIILLGIHFVFLHQR